MRYPAASSPIRLELDATAAVLADTEKVQIRSGTSDGQKRRSGTERRRFVRQRVPVAQPVEVEYRAAIPVTGQIADLGEGGAFIVTRNPSPEGTGLHYKFYLPDDRRPIEGEGRVVREEQTVGMAVEFQGLTQEDNERIKMFVASVLFGFSGGS